jgi:hypothetical protein
MNVDIDNQFHRYHRLRLTESIFSFLYYFDGGKYLLLSLSLSLYIYIYYCRIVHGCNRRVIDGKSSHQ